MKASRVRVGVMAVVSAAVMVFALLGCGASAVDLTEKDDGTSVELQVGQDLVISLPANLTTGFSWTVADDAGGLLKAPEPTYAEGGAKGVVGAGGTQTFTFSAQSTGSGALKLEYRRPWETTATPEAVFGVDVTVK